MCKLIKVINIKKIMDILPSKVILQIISKIKYWEDIRSIKNCCKKINKIIILNANNLFEERKISLNYVYFNDEYQINKKGNIVRIRDGLPFYMLPYEYQTEQKCIDAIIHDYRSYDYVHNKFRTQKIKILAANKMCCTKNITEINIINLQKFGLILKFFDEQTEEICLIAIKQNGHALEFVEKQTEQICLMAVQQDGLSLMHVKKQTDSICIEAVKNKGCALQLVKCQTLEIIMEALKCDKNAIVYIKNVFLRERLRRKIFKCS